MCFKRCLAGLLTIETVGHFRGSLRGRVSGAWRNEGRAGETRMSKESGFLQENAEITEDLSIDATAFRVGGGVGREPRVETQNIGSVSTLGWRTERRWRSRRTRRKTGAGLGGGNAIRLSRRFLSPRAGLEGVGRDYPPLKRWAIFGRPCLAKCFVLRS
jgi:hypothetical protein